MTAQPASRQRWLVPVLVVVVSVTVGGGLLARELYRRPQASPSEPIVVATSTAPLSPAQEPGPDKVGVTPQAAMHPQDDAVRNVLQTYFDSINTRDYKKWSTVVSNARRAAQPYDTWNKGVRSSKDGSILVYRIEAGAQNSLRVLVGFTSTQNVEDAPEWIQATCIHWRLMFPMVIEGNGFKIDKTDEQHPDADKC
ncbi:MAG TPA: hypothetical protein VJX66_00430 [Amycolatopsis sp.]|nr:hypothetical protein [Amycolatopsis sp.]